MRLRTVLAVVLLAALALPAGANAVEGNPKRYTLSWVEHLRKDERILMTFRVRQVHFQFEAWAAQVEFHNRSQSTIRIRPQFALLVSKTKGQDPNFQALLVRRSQPTLPRILFPGQRWKGVMAGPGRPRNARGSASTSASSRSRGSSATRRTASVGSPTTRSRSAKARS